jgi:hypothetical protein
MVDTIILEDLKFSSFLASGYAMIASKNTSVIASNLEMEDLLTLSALQLFYPGNVQLESISINNALVKNLVNTTDVSQAILNNWTISNVNLTNTAINLVGGNISLVGFDISNVTFVNRTPGLITPTLTLVAEQVTLLDIVGRNIVYPIWISIYTASDVVIDQHTLENSEIAYSVFVTVLYDNEWQRNLTISRCSVSQSLLGNVISPLYFNRLVISSFIVLDTVVVEDILHAPIVQSIIVEHVLLRNMNLFRFIVVDPNTVVLEFYNVTIHSCNQGNTAEAYETGLIQCASQVRFLIEDLLVTYSGSG